MLDMLKQLATSKKAVATIAGVIVTAVARFGLDLDETATATLISPILAYIIGQGWADSGKEAARIQTESLKPPVPADRE